MQPSLLWNATRAQKNIPARQWKPASLIKHGAHEETKWNQIHHWFCPNQLSGENIYLVSKRPPGWNKKVLKVFIVTPRNGFATVTDFLTQVSWPCREFSQKIQVTAHRYIVLWGKKTLTNSLVTTPWENNSELHAAVRVLLPRRARPILLPITI